MFNCFGPQGDTCGRVLFLLSYPVQLCRLAFTDGVWLDGCEDGVTILTLFIGLIIEIMRLILEFLKCENLGTRIFKYSHTPSEAREFRYDSATRRPKILMNLFLMCDAKIRYLRTKVLNSRC